MEASKNGFDKGFSWKMALCTCAGYLFATVPPVFVDPLLKHHVRFGARQYPLALYFVIPLAATVLVITRKVMGSTTRIGWCVAPYLLALLVSTPLYLPEFPHGSLVVIGLLWLVLDLVTLWIKSYEMVTNDHAWIAAASATATSQIEYIKEVALFWRTLLIGLAGGYIAVVVSWVSLAGNVNAATVGGNESEVFVLTVEAIGGILLFTIGVLICPVAEANKKYVETVRLFPNVGSGSDQTSPTKPKSTKKERIETSHS